MKIIKCLLLVLCLSCFGCSVSKQASLDKFEKWVLECPEITEYINYIVDDGVITHREYVNAKEFYLYIKGKHLQEDIIGGPC